jgi:hypothetical protein
MQQQMETYSGPMDGRSEYNPFSNNPFMPPGASANELLSNAGDERAVQPNYEYLTEYLDYGS